MARELGAWYVRAFGGEPNLKLGSFTPPPIPRDSSEELRKELAELRAVADAERSAVENERLRAEEALAARLSAEERARKEGEERTQWQRLAEEAEAAASEVRAQLAALQAQAENLPTEQLQFLEERATEAAESINLDEAATRALVDAQVR